MGAVDNTDPQLVNGQGDKIVEGSSLQPTGGEEFGERNHWIKYFGVEARTVVVNPLYCQEEDNDV